MQLLDSLWQIPLFLIVLLGPTSICLCLVLFELKKNNQNLIDIFLSILTYWCSIEVCVGLFLGIFNQFFLISVLILELILFEAGYLVLHARRDELINYSSKISKFGPKLSNSEILIISSISFSGFILLERLATLPIIDYDSLWYHLPIMARWYQEGAFMRMQDFLYTRTWTTDQISYYPFNWEVLCTLFVMPFQDDFLVALPNLLSWIMLGLSIYLISRRFDARRDYSIAAVSLTLKVPLILQHVNSLYIDFPFAAFFLMSIYFAILYHQMRSPFKFALFLLSIGMLFGIKMSAFGYGILPVLILCSLEVRSIFLQKRFPQLFDRSIIDTIPIVFIGSFFSLFIGGFWYFKNFVEVGNPLGDVQVQLSGLFFPGSVKLADLRQTSLASLFNFANISHLKIILTQFIVRLQLPIFLLFVQILLFPYILFRKHRSIPLTWLIYSFIF